MERRVICLITPPSPFLLDERVFMSLGILRVAAVLLARHWKVEMIDLSGVQNYEDAIADHLRVSEAQVFGLTATTPQLPAAAKISRLIREAQTGNRVILGGPHVTLVNAACKFENQHHRQGRAHHAMAILQARFDQLVAGDGEEAIFVALNSPDQQLVDADVPGGQLFLTNDRLNNLPWPARQLLDWKSYHYTIDGVAANSLIAQLGCPFECGFCGGRQSPSLRRIRTRSEENVVDEMAYLYELTGRPGMMLYDDELNVRRDKMVDLMQLIEARQKELGCEWRLRGFIKAELFTQTQAEAMFRAGFRWILVGFESGSPTILTNINKKATREENTRCLEIAHRAGLKVKALMSIGHPGETRETVSQTTDWLLTAKPDDFDITIITCYPGTPYYDQAVPVVGQPGTWVYTQARTGDRLYQKEVDYSEQADFYKGSPDGGYQAYVYTDALSSTDLVACRDQIERVVRSELAIPYPASAATIKYEHSMGQAGLPPAILRSS